jgi:alpha-glutamyl/putrescinyl thymine pyrophosphorylase clade 1
MRQMRSQGDNVLGTKKRGASPVLCFPRREPLKTEVFDSYWRFATERQAIFLRRLSGAAAPWTDDEILSTFRFTNVYRASDRVSQYLIQRVIYEKHNSPEDVVFRILLFKIFNKIETWELLSSKTGPIAYSTYRFEKYDEVLSAAMSAGNRIYSSAYIMPSGGKQYTRKHRAHLRLLERMMEDRLPKKLVACKSMKESFALLLQYPMIGEFLAYQYATDLNYAELTSFSEMDFVIPGPGARSGITKCFSDLRDWSEEDLIRWVTENQESEFSTRGLKFNSLWGRPLQLIDCQNLFCEIDKYARVRFPDAVGRFQRTRIKRKFSANSTKIHPWYPPKWGLNAMIADDFDLARTVSAS